MPFQYLVSEKSRIDRLAQDLHSASQDADLMIQKVFANHLVLAAAGLIESSVNEILSEYARRHGNDRVKRFVGKTIDRNNSLNCDKIKNILDLFDPDWWRMMEADTSFDQREAVDSLKTLRDLIAHGKPNGTGFSVVRSYYMKSTPFLDKLSIVVLGY